MPKRMADVFSVGYSGLTPTQLRGMALFLGALVIDTRSNPASRKVGFSRKALEQLLGDRYVWMGDTLGGRLPKASEVGLTKIRTWSAAGQRTLLLCVEAAPGDCHRHHMIAKQLLPDHDVRHIIDDEVIRASELQRAIDDDDDYECESFDDITPGKT
jgi:uncharacterized protein (DUF488 family)